MQKFFGFYWTLPVNWTGFQSLPRNVDEAADASRTIRISATTCVVGSRTQAGCS